VLGIADVRGVRVLVRRILGDRGDPVRDEREQAFLRLVIVSLGMFYLGVAEDVAIEAGFVSFLLSSWSILLWTYLRPESSVVRRVLAVVLDNVGISWALAVYGELAAPWFPLYLWVVFGNTLRYGVGFLYVSSVLSILGFSAVLVGTEYWVENRPLGIGMLVSLFVLPAYAAALAQRLRDAQAVAEEASEAKGRFLANMSHEIRTPLNGIIGAAELLGRRDLPREARSLVNVIVRSGEVLLGLINDVLDLSKVESGRMTCRRDPFDLHQCLNGVAELLGIEARKKGVRLTVSIDPRLPFRVLGDEGHLKQVLINLVGNAVKFTEEGEVELRCMEVARRRDGVVVRFSVRDTGIGIPEEKQAEILEPFVQADGGLGRRYGGTGLGVAIARDLVALMGGNLSLESRPGRGSVFWFELPMRVDWPAMEAARLPVEGASVLVLEGDSSVMRRYADRLRAWSLEVMVVNGLREAEGALREAEADCAPVVALLVDERFRAVVESRLPEWRRGGLVGADVRLIVPSGMPGPLAPEERVKGGCVRVESEEDLFNALHVIDGAVGLDGGPALEGRGEQVWVPRELVVADDNATNRLILSSLLRGAGHRVVEAADGEALLHLLEEGEYDVVLVDMHMPDMTGVDAYRLYRFAHAGEDAVPFVVVTADVTEATRRECIEAGISQVLPKPVQADRLLRLVDEVAGARAPVVRGPKEVAEVPDVVDVDGIPLVDEAKVGELLALDGDGELLEGLVECFRSDAGVVLDRVREAVESGDLAALRRQAHALRGNAANVGLTRLQEEMERWESLGEVEFREMGAEAVDELERLVRVSVRRLSSCLGKSRSEAVLRAVS